MEFALELGPSFTTYADFLAATFFAILAVASLIVQVLPSLNHYIDYGKLSSPSYSSGRNSFRYTEFRVPRHYFKYFYAWGLLCNLLCWKFIPDDGDSDQGPGGLLAVWLLLIHLLRRLVESVMFLPARRESTMHVGHFLLGVCYYAVIALTMNLRRPKSFHVRNRELASLVVFIWASYNQWRSHQILAIVRRHKGPGELGLPRGLYFNQVSCPHYFFEMVLYVVFLCLKKGQVALWANLFWLVVGLGGVAMRTHRAYIETFGIDLVAPHVLVPWVL